MVDKKKTVSQEQKNLEENSQQIDDGEYGVEQMLASNQEDLDNVRKHSSYHYSHDQLQHKEDRITRETQE
jgi:hypothetical protein